MISVIQDWTQQLLHQCNGVKIKTPCQLRQLPQKAATKQNVVFWNILRNNLGEDMAENPHISFPCPKLSLATVEEQKSLMS